MSDHTTIPDGFKRCSKGDKCVHPEGPVLPATNEYFPKDQSAKDGLCYSCKECQRVAHRRYRTNNPTKAHDYAIRYGEKHREELREKDRQRYKADPDKMREKERCYRETHPDKVKTVQHNYHAKHAEAIHERKRLHRLANLDQMRARDRRRRLENPEKARAKEQRREALKQGLPSAFSISDWQFALKYWGGCAYCGHPPSLFDLHYVLHQEHFIPAIAGGGYVAGNIIPACQSCNLSKSNKLPDIWVIQRFGKRKGRIILTQIQDYFSIVRSGHETDSNTQ